MARTSLYDLAKTGEKVLIEGTLVYGALREKRKPTRESKYDNNPRFTITLADPKVLKGGDTELGKHILDDGITHGSYKSKSGKYAGKTLWGFDSKSNFPPEIYTKKTGSEHMPADQFLENELASGQTVQVLFSIYYNKKWDQKAGSLDGVVIEDPEDIKYIGGGTDFSDFLGKPKGNLKDFAAGKSETASNDADASSDAPTETEADKADDAAVNNEADDIFG